MKAVRSALGSVAAATILAASFAAPAMATNQSTESGYSNEGACAPGEGFTWVTEAILTENLANDESIDAGLKTNRDGDAVEYSNGGYITEVNPLFGDPGLFEMNHFNIPQSNSQVWRIPTATNHTITNAKVTFTLPENLHEGAKVTFDGVSTTNRMTAWGGAYANYEWKPTTTEAVDNGDGTWTVDLGTIPAGEARVYQFNVDMSDAPEGWRNTPYQAKATLNGNYISGENEFCPEPTPPSSSEGSLEGSLGDSSDESEGSGSSGFVPGLITGGVIGGLVAGSSQGSSTPDAPNAPSDSADSDNPSTPDDSKTPGSPESPADPADPQTPADSADDESPATPNQPSTGGGTESSPASESGQRGGQLALTGVSGTSAVLGVAALLTLAGATLLVARRRQG